MNESEFWERVKELIKRRNTTQEKFALACDIAYGTFRGWIRRGIFPTLYHGYIIARVLGVSVEYLMLGMDEEGKRREAKLEKARTLLQDAEKALDRIK
jgi:transcriptional regulator with XRE-family HTH domain